MAGLRAARLVAAVAELLVDRAESRFVKSAVQVGVGVVVLIAFCSINCSRQTTLADRLGSVNHVVVYKRTSPHQAVSMSFDGEEAQRIVRTVCSAKRSGGDAAPPLPEIMIQFLRDTNSLAVIESAQGLFWRPNEGSVMFLDETLTLSKLAVVASEKWQAIPYEVYQQLNDRSR